MRNSGFRGETRDRLQFPAVCAEQQAMYAARPSNLARPGGMGGAREAYVCTGPITYIGQVRVHEDVEHLRAAVSGTPAQEAFITALSPSNVALYPAMTSTRRKRSTSSRWLCDARGVSGHR